MKAVLSLVLSLVLIFGALSVGTEIYKSYRVLSVFQDEMGNFAMDALELAADDRYRMEHLLKVDADVAEASLKTLMIQRYDLSEDMRPLSRITVFRQIHLTELIVNEGSFYRNGENWIQHDFPELKISGTLEVSLIALNISRQVQIPFRIDAKMRRVL